jgi:endonuclease/exonuclease/phosphatase (EEP) superfamily protein YafD
MSRRRPAPFRTLAAGLAAAAAVVPDRVGLDNEPPFVQGISLRPQATAAALLAAAALARGRRTRPMAVAVGAVALAGVAAVAGRARRSPAPAASASGDTIDLTILSANVLKGRADTGELATLIERVRPDLVVLPEAGHDFRDKLMPLVESMGYRSCVSAPIGTYEVHAVTVLVHEGLGDVSVRPAKEMRLSHVEVTGGRLGARTFYGIHATAPMQRRMIPVWRKDLRVLARWTASEPTPIVVGDFNATFDHSAFRAAVGRTRSAADGTGRGLVGTYPSRFPRWFGIQIDHVLVPAEATTRRLEIHDLAGTDHRAVSTEVTLGRV